MWKIGIVMGMLGGGLISCTGWGETKPARDTVVMVVVDSLQAYNTYKDSALMIVDTIHSDTALVSAGQVNTHNVDPLKVVEFAKTLIGVPYKYAASDPKTGFDCSGFITYVFARFNIIVPRSSIGFTNVGQTIHEKEAKPGDLILFTGTDSTEKFVGHMGLIVSNHGNIEFIHSTSGKAYGVTITPLNDYYRSRFVKVIRIFPTLP